MMTLELTVETDVAALESLYKRLLRGSDIKVEMMRDTLILTGTVLTSADATRAQQIAARFQVQPDMKLDENQNAPMKVINMLAVAGKEQVMLRVTVGEVDRSVLKQLGINVGAVISSGDFITSVMTQNALPLTAGAGLGAILPTELGGISAGKPSVGFTANAANGMTNSGVTGFWNTGGTANAAYTARFLERNGLLRTLAEPNLTAVSGETAKFLAGGEFPVPLVDNLGRISVQFKKFGVGLAFTPIVAAEDRISLKISSEVSELSNQGAVSIGSIAIPALKTRQADTTVELPSGGALAIAGLLSEDTRQNIDGVPGLKDVPVLGTLFRSRDFIKNETELVVIVQPLIVNHSARNKLAHPGSGLAPASDAKANLLGHLNRVYGKGPDAPPAGKYQGDYGFIVE
jgi:pilus assembly protein CpaC